jgi:hypothetical protein
MTAASPFWLALRPKRAQVPSSRQRLGVPEFNDKQWCKGFKTKLRLRSWRLAAASRSVCGLRAKVSQTLPSTSSPLHCRGHALAPPWHPTGPCQSLCTPKTQRCLRLRCSHQQPVEPNPTFNRSTNGRPPGTVWRYAVHFRQPGPGVLPLSPG